MNKVLKILAMFMLSFISSVVIGITTFFLLLILELPVFENFGIIKFFNCGLNTTQSNPFDCQSELLSVSLYYFTFIAPLVVFFIVFFKIYWKLQKIIK